MRRMVTTNFFRVNDPLVHYTMEDVAGTNGAGTMPKGTIPATLFTTSIGQKNPEWAPWHKGGTSSAGPGKGVNDPKLRDPGVIDSGLWEFPTHHMPSVGWLGRVHRGTPWQTIYFKSQDAGNDWARHSGPTRPFISANLMRPTRDHLLLDLFSAAIHPNATRGRLSVNQTNLAAWSAVMSGVIVGGATNDPSAIPSIRARPEVIQPAALGDPVAQIVAALFKSLIISSKTALLFANSSFCINKRSFKPKAFVKSLIGVFAKRSDNSLPALSSNRA